MTSRKPPQEQSGGDGSTNVQAGNDVHLHGLSLADARQVALDVFHANALELKGAAQIAATARAEELTNAFFAKIQSEMPESASRLADPDVQGVFFEAQREYARSGEEDLRVALVDLLAARSKEDQRNLRTLALNEAISSAGKLTEEQRRAIAWVFYLKYTRDRSSGTSDTFYDRIGEVVEALGVEVPDRQADYQHIEYVGAGAISMGSRSFADCIYGGHEGLFTEGFEESQVDPDLWARLSAKNLIVPALRDASKVQIPLLSDQDLPERLTTHGLSGDLDAIKPLFSLGRLSDEQIVEELEANVPAVQPLRKIWDDNTSAIKMMTLTSVGIALGHAYWSRLTGREAPLSIWL